MNNISVTLQLSKPCEPPEMRQAVEQFIAHPGCNTAHCAFAYVSLAGLSESIGPVLQIEEHNHIAKQWIVGIHNGITEPAAIEALTHHNNSDVRIYSPTRRINRAALFGCEKMHAKSICLTGDKRHLFAIGSANLTRAAVGIHCTNYEAGILLNTPDQRLHASFINWFTSLWNESIPASGNAIDKYSRLRDTFLRDNKVILPRLDEAPHDEMVARQHLWIEAGAMSGGDRNQIEFGPALAVFFGDLVRGQRNLTLRWHDITRTDRPLSYKVTKWNTEIWRLSMITSNQGGPSYPDQIVHFSKSRGADGDMFLIEVASPPSHQARRWRMLANRTGTLAMTGLTSGSAREYGVY